jgi:hypothetical protein
MLLGFSSSLPFVAQIMKIVATSADIALQVGI